ncbi:MAG: PhnD/SsuA/transferrin family substrate-binding protein [Ignavibacteriae bacterium]|nr:PhnD/SsuA/transferrin family substrate-binding protein [Ignavibacteriota bacterium]
MNDCLKIFQNVFLFFLVFLIFLLNDAVAQNKLRKFYRLGMSKELLEDVNVKDAQAVLEIWTEILKENFKDVDKISVSLFNNAAELVEAISKKEVDIIYTSGVIFKENSLDKKYELEPIVILNTGNKKAFDLYLFANSKNKISGFNDLKGKTIMVQGGKFKIINELWLDLLCLQNGAKNKYNFFKKVEFTEKPMQSILPVFFEKADFCIISSISYFAIKELNPQISKALYKIYERKNLVNEVICLPKSFSKTEKEIIHNASINYENLPNIKQLGKILKSLGSYTYSDSSFAGTSELWNDYQKLKNEK